MGNPALQFLGLSGAPTFELDTVHIGSDDLSESMRRERAGITHERYGVPVASRMWKQARIWNLNINKGDVSYINSLRDYFEAGSFYLYPDIDTSATTKYTVYWVGDSFNPRHVVGDYYALQATFKETTIGAGTPTYVGSSTDQVVGGDLTVNGDLTVGGEFAINTMSASTIYLDGVSIEEIGNGQFNGDIFVNYDGPDADSHIYFYNNTNPSGASIYFNSTNEYFKFSNIIDIDAGQLVLDADNDITTRVINFGSGVSGGVIAHTSTNPIRFTINDDILAQSNIAIDGNLYVNYSGPDGDSYIYFYDGGAPNDEYLKWNNTTSRFDFSTDVAIQSKQLFIDPMESAVYAALRFGDPTTGANISFNYTLRQFETAKMWNYSSGITLDVWTGGTNAGLKTDNVPASSNAYVMAFSSGDSSVNLAPLYKSKAMKIPAPYQERRHLFFYTETNIQLEELSYVNVGAGSNFSGGLYYSTNITSASPTLCVPMPTNGNSTTGVKVVSGSMAATHIPANNYVWIDCSASGGTGSYELFVSTKYKEV